MAQISVVIYEYDDNTALRDELRPAHRAFLDSREGLVLSGPTAAGGAERLGTGSRRCPTGRASTWPARTAGRFASPASRPSTGRTAPST